jgi:hypothetical protein
LLLLARHCLVHPQFRLRPWMACALCAQALRHEAYDVQRRLAVATLADHARRSMKLDLTPYRSEHSFS